MNPTILESALPDMEVFLGNASDALAQIEADRHGAAEYIERFTYADPEAALGGNLDDLFHTLLIVLDAAEMKQMAPDPQSNRAGRRQHHHTAHDAPHPPF